MDDPPPEGWELSPFLLDEGVLPKQRLGGLQRPRLYRPLSLGAALLREVHDMAASETTVPLASPSHSLPGAP